MKKTRDLTTCALLCALSMAFMLLGSVLDVLDLSAVMLASVMSLFIYVEFGGRYAWTAYAVTGILALLLLPSKAVAAEYLLFGGFYPICRVYLMRFSRWLSLLLRLAIFNLSFTVITLLLNYLITPTDAPLPLQVLTYAVGNAAFLLYDHALSRVGLLWIRYLAPRLKRRK